MDIPINLISLGSFPCCKCHSDFHAGLIARGELLAVVGEREGMEVDLIEETLRAMHNRITKRGCWHIRAGMVEIGRDTWACAACGVTL